VVESASARETQGRGFFGIKRKKGPRVSIPKGGADLLSGTKRGPAPLRPKKKKSKKSNSKRGKGKTTLLREDRVNTQIKKKKIKKQISRDIQSGVFSRRSKGKKHGCRQSKRGGRPLLGKIPREKNTSAPAAPTSQQWEKKNVERQEADSKSPAYIHGARAKRREGGQYGGKK